MKEKAEMTMMETSQKMTTSSKSSSRRTEAVHEEQLNYCLSKNTISFRRFRQEKNFKEEVVSLEQSRELS